MNNFTIQYTATLALTAKSIYTNCYSDIGSSLNNKTTATDMIMIATKSAFHVSPISATLTKLTSIDGEFLIIHCKSELQQLVINEQSNNIESIPPGKTRLTESFGDYSDRIEEKRSRLEERAAKARKESDRYYQSSKERASHIPFGQPILVGHHSEARSRREADRIFNDMGKSVSFDKKAHRLESRAESIGTGGIASDDPEALKKLKQKLSNLESSQSIMKRVNALIRRSDKNQNYDIIDDLIGAGLSEKQAKTILEPDHMGRRGFASFSLTNNNAETRRIKKRIQDLEKLHNSEPIEYHYDKWSMFEDDGRIQVKFSAKPNDEICAILRQHGFVYSPSRRTSVRKITNNSVLAAKKLASKLMNISK
ncbi:DUF3560 domain-containing protein [Photobacterium damselae subsp. damselae]|uniref:DUF3560 domain-containing protein n=1 Tax=Photobacterium damselae TaxID=38293 RepID=UPI001F276010|nr:DUF3560 domain-containing protein [Photobacterium damselae]UKA23348.1 DUF3560 domain-containing protein [Photobacterium damselae subsp. damselae]